MGANTFVTMAVGASAREAFSVAVSNAQWESGHGGYTGTIAEKHEFVMIHDSPRQAFEAMKKAFEARKKAVGATPLEYLAKRIDGMGELLASGKWGAEETARALIDAGDERIHDKWGPAGCIEITPGSSYLFFGWASS